ncbi:UPF0183-domain-containing protein [Aureobasidium sp. EXF-10727]|nr:UPF0183-domain-containing protein [Aureobasidium sp. EXF-10727]
MAEPTSLPFRAAHALGFMVLGASLFDILTKLKSDTRTFPKIDLTFSSETPLKTTIIVSLPKNGFRLRFDAPDQRLRLIEITDFTRMLFTFKGGELVPAQSLANARSYLTYKRVYQLFGPTYPGEYIRLKHDSNMGLYVLSWPGLSVTFPIPIASFTPNKDYAAMLTASASPATAMAIYEGRFWPEVRKDLFTRVPTNPRSSSLLGRPKEGPADEVEHVNVYGAGRVELLRRSGSKTPIILSQTTPQDLITELGPPDAVMPRSSLNDDPPNRVGRNRAYSVNGPNRGAQISHGSYSSNPSSYSSTNTDTYETDFDEDEETNGAEANQANEQQYYCYFEHGFDILLGPPVDISLLPKDADEASEIPRSTLTAIDGHLTVTQIIFHGNIPGSYPFNRHRRSRWSLNYIPLCDPITSESLFPSYHQTLVKSFSHIWPASDMSEGMVIVRSWGGDADSMTGSAILINGEMDMEDDMEFVNGSDGWEREKKDENGDERWLRNTKLYKFPGLMFEVMHNGAVSALTVC